MYYRFAGKIVSFLFWSVYALPSKAALDYEAGKLLVLTGFGTGKMLCMSYAIQAVVPNADRQTQS